MSSGGDGATPAFGDPRTHRLVLPSVAVSLIRVLTGRGEVDRGSHRKGGRGFGQQAGSSDPPAHVWIDPRDAETLFGDFSAYYFAAIKPRLTDGTAAKYQSHLATHLLPQWSAWPLIAIFNSHAEIVKLVSELHEDRAESTVASIFATFSTFLNAARRR